MSKALIIFLAVFLLGVFTIVILPFLITPERPAKAPAEARPAVKAERGVFRSDDGGNTWSSKVAIGAGRRTIERFRINDLKLNPHDPNTLVLATDGNGLFLSFDRGASWGKLVDRAGVLDPASKVLAVAFDPGDADAWYLAVYQQDRGRVLLTRDAGETFSEIYLVPLPKFGVFDLLVEPLGRKLSIVTGQVGYLESENQGRTWRVLRWFRDGLLRLAIDPSNPAARYVVSSRGSIFKTPDAGLTWVDLTPNLRAFAGSTRNQRLSVDSSGTLWLGSNFGLLRSRDGGRSFEAPSLIIPPQALPVLAIAVDPSDSRHLIVSAARELYETPDAGASWSIRSAPGQGRVTHLAFDPANAKTIYAVVQP